MKKSLSKTSKKSSPSNDQIFTWHILLWQGKISLIKKELEEITLLTQKKFKLNKILEDLYQRIENISNVINNEKETIQSAEALQENNLLKDQMVRLKVQVKKLYKVMKLGDLIRQSLIKSLHQAIDIQQEAMYSIHAEKIKVQNHLSIKNKESLPKKSSDQDPKSKHRPRSSKKGQDKFPYLQITR